MSPVARRVTAMIRPQRPAVGGTGVSPQWDLVDLSVQDSGWRDIRPPPRRRKIRCSGAVSITEPAWSDERRGTTPTGTREAPRRAPPPAGERPAVALHQRLPDRSQDWLVHRLPSHHRRDPRLDHLAAGRAPEDPRRPPGAPLGQCGLIVK